MTQWYTSNDERKKKLRCLLIEQWRYMDYAARIANPITWQTFIK